MEDTPSPTMATSPLGRVYSNQICGPRRQTVHQGGRCVAKAYITASWQRGRDQPAVLNQRIIRGCDRVGTVTYSDQFARSDQPRHTVVRIALRPERPRQPHVVAYGHRASTAHGRRSWEEWRNLWIALQHIRKAAHSMQICC